VGDLLKSFVRTFVPVVVGLILAAFAKVQIDVDETALTQVINAVFVGGYYAVVRFLEVRFPQFGWLLGLPVPPAYPDAPVGDQ
jgi:hypothetical protein